MNQETELLERFQSPPDEYGFHTGWFWEGGRLLAEKLTRQLEEFKAKGAGGTFFYARYVFDEPYALSPAYRSPEWWDLFRHAVAEHQRLGMQIHFSDWAMAHSSWNNHVLVASATDPALAGKVLTIHEKSSDRAGDLRLTLPDGEGVLCAAAHRETDGGLDAGTRQDLLHSVKGNAIVWHAPEAGWLVSAVTSKATGLDFLSKAVIEDWMRGLWEGYADHLREFLGGAFKGMIQDELITLSGDLRFSPLLLERFRKSRGYDPRPHLIALFRDVGKDAVRIRCDYHATLAELLEENVYRVVADWFKQRSMVVGTVAFWGRQDALSMTGHYGDVFRLLRHYAFTGCEDPQTEPRVTPRRRFFDAKVSSSAAHIYRKKRAAVCTYWGAGWGMTLEQSLAWTNENYAYGLNLLMPHLGGYSLGGGWYEWVPPEQLTFQPYWAHYQTYAEYARRLSFMLSQGTHVADAAILFPTTTLHANSLGGNRYKLEADISACETNNIAETLYARNVDFDLVDDDTLCRAEVRRGVLAVSGIEFRAVVLPPLTTIRIETMRRIKEFYDQGGAVVAFRRLPNSSAERGQDDPELRAILSHVFGIPSSDEYTHRTWDYPRVHEGHFADSVRTQRNAAGGVAMFMPGEQNKQTGLAAVDLGLLVSSAIQPDVRCPDRDVLHLHKKVGDLDVYFIHNARPEARALTISLRVEGQPSIWDAFTGKVAPHPRWQREQGRTRLRLALEANQAVIVGFRGSEPLPAVISDNLTGVISAEAEDGGVRVRGYSMTGGKKTVRLEHRGSEFQASGRVDEPPGEIPLDGPWEFRLIPTRDNRWGDYRYPATTARMGTEARRFRYAEEVDVPGDKLGWHQKDFDDSRWPEHTFSFGPYWHVAGPFAAGKEPEGLLRDACEGTADPSKQHDVPGGSPVWSRYHFSLQYGNESKDVHQQVQNGLTGVSDRFLVFDGVDSPEDMVRYLHTTVVAPSDGEWDFVLGGSERFPARAWVNGKEVASDSTAWVKRSDGSEVTLVIAAGTDAKKDQERSGQPFGWTAAKESLDGDNVEARVRVRLKAGRNIVVIRLVQTRGATIWGYAVFLRPAADPSAGRPPIPRLRWFLEPTGLTYDIMPSAARRTGWYRFEAPPGMRSMKLKLDAVSAVAWVNGRAVEIRDGVIEMEAALEDVSQVALRVEMKPGCHAGAALPEPVAFECESGCIALGDWCEHALESYSGGAVYAKEFVLEKRHLAGRAFLELGRVAGTAEVRVNGEAIGVGLASPWRFDVTGRLRENVNRVEVVVYNTLANHYSVGIPSKYVFEGQTVSGLLGPARLRFASDVTLMGRPAGTGSWA